MLAHDIPDIDKSPAVPDVKLDDEFLVVLPWQSHTGLGEPERNQSRNLKKRGDRSTRLSWDFWVDPEGLIPMYRKRKDAKKYQLANGFETFASEQEKTRSAERETLTAYVLNIGRGDGESLDFFPGKLLFFGAS